MPFVKFPHLVATSEEGAGEDPEDGRDGEGEEEQVTSLGQVKPARYQCVQGFFSFVHVGPFTGSVPPYNHWH